MVEELTDAIKYYCSLLSINHIEEIYQKEAEEAAKANISYQQYLYNLLKAQAELRVENSINAKIKKAKFPYIKTLSDYDFSFQPKID